MSLSQLEQQRDCKVISGFASLLSAAKTLLDIDLPCCSKELSCLLSPSISDSEQCCVFPALDLKHEERMKSSGSSNVCGRKRLRNQRQRSIKEITAQALSIPFLCARTSEKLTQAPYSMIGNFSDSFTFLVRSRLVSCIKALLQQRNKLSNRIFLNMLTNPSIEPFQLTTIVTSFHAIPIHDESNQSMKVKQSNPGESFECNSSREVILPLLFEVTIDLKLFGEHDITVPLNAPGTIAGTFRRNQSNDGLLQHVEVAFDTKVLLESMMQQARQVAKKVVSLAAEGSNLLITTIPSYSDSALSVHAVAGEQISSHHPKQPQGLPLSSSSDPVLYDSYVSVKRKRGESLQGDKQSRVDEASQFDQSKSLKGKAYTTGDFGLKKSRHSLTRSDTNQDVMIEKSSKNATWKPILHGSNSSKPLLSTADGAESEAIAGLSLLYQSKSSDEKFFS